MFIIDDPSYQLRLGRDLSNLPESSWCPPHAPAIHSIHSTYSNPDYVLQSGSLHCILWTGHLYSLCNNTICLHPYWVSCGFIRIEQLLHLLSAHPQLFRHPFSPEAPASLKMHGLAQIELLPWCSQFFAPFSLHLVYSPWRCTGQWHISVGEKLPRVDHYPRTMNILWLFLGLLIPIWDPELTVWLGGGQLVMPLKLFDC